MSPLCKAPGCTEVDDLAHSLVQCPANQLVGTNLMQLLGNHQPNVTPAAAIRLEFEVEEHLELPLVWVSAGTLLSIWEQRKLSSKVQPHITRSELEAKVNILRETRLANTATLLDEMITSIFEH